VRPRRIPGLPDCPGCNATVEKLVHIAPGIAAAKPCGCVFAPGEFFGDELLEADHERELVTDGGQPVDEDRAEELNRFALECALRAAWATEFWKPGDPDYGFVSYLEAAAARNIGLLRGFEELADDVDRRGILPQSDTDQARLVTDGGRR
jgi:hypothetical protein